MPRFLSTTTAVRKIVAWTFKGTQEVKWVVKNVDDFVGNNIALSKKAHTAVVE